MASFLFFPAVEGNRIGSVVARVPILSASEPVRAAPSSVLDAPLPFRSPSSGSPPLPLFPPDPPGYRARSDGCQAARACDRVAE